MAITESDDRWDDLALFEGILQRGEDSLPYPYHTIFENTRKALEYLVQASIAAQKEYRASWSPISLLNQFCTIRLGGPRRCGHTVAGVVVARKYFENPFFCFPSHVMAEDAVRASGNGRNSIPHDRACHWNSSRLLGADFDCMVVDCGSVLEERDRQGIFQHCLSNVARYEPFCLILMG